MAVVLLKRGNEEHFVRRINALTGESAGQWRKLNLPDMLSHLNFSIDMSLGKIEGIEAVDKILVANPVTRGFVKLLFFYVMTTWPPSKATTPENLRSPAKGDFEEERTKLLGLLDDFVAKLEESPDTKTVNPMLGDTSLRFWSRLHGVHLNHHLRQFGV